MWTPERLRRTRLAYRALGVVFGALTVYLTAGFAAGLAEEQVRADLLFYGSLMGATAVGLWLVRGWGRLLGLLVSVAVAGLATLALLAGILDERAPVLVPGVVLAASAGIAYLLSRPLFGLPDEPS